jgi:hypothetical protein
MSVPHRDLVHTGVWFISRPISHRDLFMPRPVCSLHRNLFEIGAFHASVHAEACHIPEHISYRDLFHADAYRDLFHTVTYFIARPVSYQIKFKPISVPNSSVRTRNQIPKDTWSDRLKSRILLRVDFWWRTWGMNGLAYRSAINNTINMSLMPHYC